jgi:hypothetical protein
MMQQSGFSDAAFIAETGFNSSPKTKGVLFRAVKGNLQKTTSWSASIHGDNNMGGIESDPKKENRVPET